MKIYCTSRYQQKIKELKKKHREKTIRKIQEVVNKLSKDEITAEYSNHPLKDANGIKDIHIEYDLVLLYRYNENGNLILSLELYDLRNHKELLSNKKKKKKYGDKELHPYKESKKQKHNDDLELTKGGYVNLDAGNVPIGIAAFNNSTNPSSNSSMSVAEALVDLSNNECYNIDEDLNRTFIETKEFTRQWKHLGFGDNELFELQNQILKDNVKKIPLGSNVYKIRFSPSYTDNGKSSSQRVIYLDVMIREEIYFLFCYLYLLVQ